MKKAGMMAAMWLCCAVVSAAQAQEPADVASRVRAIESLVGNYHRAGTFDGSLMVAFEGEVIYKGGFGLANREWDRPSEPETRFYIASITKSFTATLVLMLAQDDKVDLDASVSTYLLDLEPVLGDRITVRQLLGHTSGLVRDWSEFSKDESRDSCTSEAIIRILNTTDLLFEPGTEFSYSNSGYALGAAIIERVTGLPYALVLERRILEPLGMNHTGVWTSTTIISKRAVGYNPRLMCEPLNISADGAACGVGAGGLYSTVLDLHKFDQGLLGDALLTEESKTEAFEGGHGGYGLGWYVTPFEIEGAQHKLIRHSGIAAGFGGVLWRMPAEGHSISILQNNNAVPWPLANDILNVLYDTAEDLEPPVEAVATRLVCTLIDQGIDAALELYGTMPRQEGRKRITGPRQATGRPNSGPVDSNRAWASQTPDDQQEWLLLDFGEPKRPARIDIYENYNPGAIDRISAFDNDGKEFGLSLSAAEVKRSPEGVSILSVPVQIEFDTTRLKIYIDSPAVAGWNEIDAVALVGADGAEHWAQEARASSTGADGSPHISLTTVPDDMELNKLGHAYLELGRLASATLVFEFNARAHPESIVAQQALAATLRRLGELDRAEIAARRAQELEKSEQHRVRENLARLE